MHVGALAHSEGTISINGDSFIRNNVEFNLVLEVRKAGRHAMTSLAVIVVRDEPPIMDIVCASQEMCKTDERGQVITDDWLCGDFVQTLYM